MFFKNSRYKKEPAEVTLDVRGRRLKSVRLRIASETEGTFLHTIAKGDRFDHLGYKYYQSPKKWWQIVDANPDFLSPRDLLGTGVIRSLRVPVTIADNSKTPPWSELAGQLTALVGIEDFHFEEQIHLTEKELQVADEMLFVAEERFERAVLILYNRVNLSKSDLLSAVEAAGFNAGEAQDIGRIGKQIVIPPDGI